jgi:peroxiredoxin-like protein
MNDASQTIQRKEKPLLFRVDLKWIGKQQGMLSAADVNNEITVATPPDFGGEGEQWSPEHLFLGSISSCFMTTYLAFTKKFQFSIAGLSCNIIGEVGLISGKYQFTHINIFPKIYVEEESVKVKAKKALEKTEQYCLIAHSVAAQLSYHPEILKGKSDEAVTTENVIESSDGDVEPILATVSTR